MTGPEPQYPIREQLEPIIKKAVNEIRALVSVIDQPYALLPEFHQAGIYKGVDLLADSRFRELASSKTRVGMDVELPLAFRVMWAFLLGTHYFTAATYRSRLWMTICNTH